MLVYGMVRGYEGTNILRYDMLLILSGFIPYLTQTAYPNPLSLHKFVLSNVDSTHPK
ncbi:hypothetical protein LX64_01467 [Chitinophaga skermanii]|uniref:Uncharacterized protein n=1 Tax=Chitinophaga skermanii TaxID=331697 RepID=A0A327QZF4_9BACT|nr:hypothetical protein LX64_01467 [Chitinophaga skermanii]